MSQCSKTTKDGNVRCRGSEGHAGSCFLGGVTLADFDRSAEEARREKDADIEAARWQKRIAETIEAVSERFEMFLAMAEDVAEGHRPAKDLTEAIAQERAFLGVSGA